MPSGRQLAVLVTLTRGRSVPRGTSRKLPRSVPAIAGYSLGGALPDNNKSSTAVHLRHAFLTRYSHIQTQQASHARHCRAALQLPVQTVFATAPAVAYLYAHCATTKPEEAPLAAVKGGGEGEAHGRSESAR